MKRLFLFAIFALSIQCVCGMQEDQLRLDSYNLVCEIARDGAPEEDISEELFKPIYDYIGQLCGNDWESFSQDLKDDLTDVIGEDAIREDRGDSELLGVLGDSTSTRLYDWLYDKVRWERCMMAVCSAC